MSYNKHSAPTWIETLQVRGHQLRLMTSALGCLLFTLVQPPVEGSRDLKFVTFEINAHKQIQALH